MSRFVILEHDWPTRHFDLLLEAGPLLRAWRLSAFPQLGSIVDAEPNSNHRLRYLDYAGPVSGGRGVVRRRDWGMVEWIADEADYVGMSLSGEVLVGRAELRLTPGGWRFAFLGDQYG